MTREEAIKEIDYLINDGVVTETFVAPLEQKSIDALKLAIEALSQPPRAKGRWKLGSELDNVDYEHFIYCSNCHKEAYWDTDYGQQTFDFCSNCGASMDGADMRESE